MYAKLSKAISEMFRDPNQMNVDTPVRLFRFHEPFDVNTINGSCFGNVYFPHEIMLKIFTYIDPKVILQYSVVCKKWCNIIKSDELWHEIYNRREYPKKAKHLPWYVFYSYYASDNFTNLLRNGNGNEGFNRWVIMRNAKDKWTVENPPVGADNLPLGVADFNGHTSCFATSHADTSKYQQISLHNKRLMRLIIYKFMPRIYASEWMAGRFDCGCKYQLRLKGYDSNAQQRVIFEKCRDVEIMQWEGKAWEKIEISVDNYTTDLAGLIFLHRGSDTQYWAGFYGSKMAGSVLRFDFDSLEPSEGGNKISTCVNVFNPRDRLSNVAPNDRSASESDSDADF